MKITKTPKQANKFAKAREIANKGCDRCPCCGETKSWSLYQQEGIDGKGIVKPLFAKTWTRGIFHKRYLKRDKYKCCTCGAEWESSPYRYN